MIELKNSIFLKLKEIRKIFKYFIYWRLALFVPVFLAPALLIYRSGYDYTNILNYIKPYDPVKSYFLFPWANFDGVHYLAIAGRGYINEARFFPLFPLLIRFVSNIFGSGPIYGASYFFSGLIVSNLSFLAGLYYFYKLIKLDYSAKVASNSILFLLIFSTTFFFAAIYSEGLFFLLLVLSFYFARKKKWYYASVAVFLLSVTRLVGVLIIPALVYEFIVQQRGGNFLEKLKSLGSWGNIRTLLPIFISPTGFFVYVYYNLQKWGDPLYFIKAHGELANARSVTSVVFLPRTLYRYFNILVTLPINQYEWFLAAIELSSVIFAAGLLYLAWRKGIRFSYILFSALSMFLPISSGTFSGMPRYVLILFPVFVAISLLENRYIKIVYVLVSIVLLFMLLVFFSRGYFVA